MIKLKSIALTTASSEILETRLTKKDKVVYFLKAFILSLAVVCTIAFTFLHEYFPLYSDSYLEHRSTYQEIIDERNSTFDLLLTNLKNGQLSVINYIQALDDKKVYYQDKLDTYHLIKDNLIQESSIIGYFSLKAYLLGISFPILGMFTALFLFYLSVKYIKDKREKTILVLISTALLCTWGYWVAWSNLYHTQDPARAVDFPRSYYNFALYVCPLIFAGLFYLSITYFKTVKEKIANVIFTLNKLLYKDLPEKNLVHPDNISEYRQLRVKLTRKVQENA